MPDERAIGPASRGEPGPASRGEAGPVSRGGAAAGRAEGPSQAHGYAPEAFEDGGPGPLVECWRILRRRKGTLILIAFLGGLAGLLYTLPQTPVYQARTSLEIQTLNQDFLNIRQVSQVSEPNTWDTLTDIQTQIRILQSDSLVERVIAKLNLSKPSDLKQATDRVSAWRRALKLPEPEAKGAPSAWESLLKSASGGVRVRALGQTRLVEVSCDSTDAKMAATFANALANEFIEQNIEARWKMTQRTGEWLTRQIDELRIKLERSEDALQAYARQSGLMFTSEKTNVAEEKLRQLQEELSKAQADRISRQSRYEMAHSSAPETLADILNDVALRDRQTRLTDLRRQHAELSATYKPEYSKVKRVQAQIVTIEAALKRERNAILERIRNDFQEAQGREKMLASVYASQARLVTEQAEKSIQYGILKREVDSTRQLYDAMLQRLKEASIAAAMRASNIRVVDAAREPLGPYKPNGTMNSALGLLAGLFLGVALVVMRERADRSIQEPGDSSFYLNLPELGVIPHSGAARHRLYYRRRKRMAEPAPAAETGLVAKSDVRDQVELASWQHKPSLVAESFRAILTSILFSGDNGNRPRVLVVTSGSPKEGKMTVASNLAIALAEVHQRVLLIDGDMRRPRLHEIFDAGNEGGLSDILKENGARAESGLAGAIQETKLPNLFLLASGPVSSAAATPLFSRQMPGLLKDLLRQFDSILIDTPPMLQMPDARVLGRLTDAVLLVVRAGHTTRDAAMAARQRFEEDGTPLLGTILNDWDPKSSGGGYDGYYKGGGYYRHYGRE